MVEEGYEMINNIKLKSQWERSTYSLITRKKIIIIMLLNLKKRKIFLHLKLILLHRTASLDSIKMPQ